MNLNFVRLLVQRLMQDIKNDHKNNWDTIRFGKEPKDKGKQKRILNILNKRNYIHEEQSKYAINLAFSVLGDELLNLAAAYSHLHDDCSKDCLIEVITFRILGHRKTKLRNNNHQLRSLKDEVQSTAEKSDFIISNFNGRKSYLHKFEYKQEPIQLYLPELGPLNPFYLKQYNCETENGDWICPSEDDVVIDCGGCWGDTPLEFAASVGRKGKVFVFEYIPKNLQILEKNLSLNQGLKNRIKVIPHPVWETSGIKFAVEDSGPASKISRNNFSSDDQSVTTLSIDDLIESEKITDIDFIKMDIEGAELNALKGALTTIQKFKPKLAISVYHSLEEYSSILLWLRDLNLGYKFYLRHFTIHAEETILFAISN